MWYFDRHNLLGKHFHSLWNITTLNRFPDKALTKLDEICYIQKYIMNGTNVCVLISITLSSFPWIPPTLHYLNKSYIYF